MDTTATTTTLTSAPARPAIGFQGDPTRKKFFVDRAAAHQQADEIVKGRYWQGGKGCAVGCLIHGSSHSDLARELGIPFSMARLIDWLFERMPNDKSKLFPLRFVQAIEAGSDTNAVWDKFALALLSDPEMGIINFTSESCKPNMQAVIDLCKRQVMGDYPRRDEWRMARTNLIRDIDAIAGAGAYKLASAIAASYVYAFASAIAASYAYEDKYAIADAFAATRRARVDNHFVWQAETLLRLLEMAK